MESQNGQRNVGGDGGPGSGVRCVPSRKASQELSCIHPYVGIEVNLYRMFGRSDRPCQDTNIADQVVQMRFGRRFGTNARREAWRHPGLDHAVDICAVLLALGVVGRAPIRRRRRGDVKTADQDRDALQTCTAVGAPWHPSAVSAGAAIPAPHHCPRPPRSIWWRLLPKPLPKALIVVWVYQLSI